MLQDDIDGRHRLGPEVAPTVLPLVVLLAENLATSRSSNSRMRKMSATAVRRLKLCRAGHRCPSLSPRARPATGAPTPRPMGSPSPERSRTVLAEVGRLARGTDTTRTDHARHLSSELMRMVGPADRAVALSVRELAAVSARLPFSASVRIGHPCVDPYVDVATDPPRPRACTVSPQQAQAIPPATPGILMTDESSSPASTACSMAPRRVATPSFPYTAIACVLTVCGET